MRKPPAYWRHGARPTGTRAGLVVRPISLWPGCEFAPVIKGGWQLASDHDPVDRARAVADMERFLDAGITAFDCADVYTGVDEMIGAFIERVRRNRGEEAANAIKVHTKPSKM